MADTIRLPDGIAVEQFLRDYWQKKPLLMPGALTDFEPPLGPEELAGLCAYEDVESRVYLPDCHGDGNETLEGPFDRDFFASLPASHWTLLANDVEKHLPDVAWVSATVDFLPAWRRDDLMVSVASDGGGVGAHIDNYDVFLLQGLGEREWFFGGSDCQALQQLAESGAEPSAGVTRSTLKTGDLLYLPPGIAHAGIARSAWCTTFSIGMLAPTVAELYAECPQAARLLADPAERYADTDLKRDEASGVQLSAQAIRRVMALVKTDPPLTETQAAVALGRVVTRNKEWLRPQPYTFDEATALARVPDARFRRHGMALFAACELDGVKRIFVNGANKIVDTIQWRILLTSLDAELHAVTDTSVEELLVWLLQHGAIEPGDDG